MRLAVLSVVLLLALPLAAPLPLLAQRGPSDQPQPQADDLKAELETGRMRVLALKPLPKDYARSVYLELKAAVQGQKQTIGFGELVLEARQSGGKPVYLHLHRLVYLMAEGQMVTASIQATVDSFFEPREVIYELQLRAADGQEQRIVKQLKADKKGFALRRIEGEKTEDSRIDAPSEGKLVFGLAALLPLLNLQETERFALQVLDPDAGQVRTMRLVRVELATGDLRWDLTAPREPQEGLDAYYVMDSLRSWGEAGRRSPPIYEYRTSRRRAEEIRAALKLAAPVQTIKPKAAKPPSVTAAPDESLSVEEYVKLGVTDPAKPWGPDDYKLAVVGFAEAGKLGPAKLPRHQSKRSGAVFARAVNPENLAVLGDTKIEMPTRLDLAQRFMTPIGKLRRVYQIGHREDSAFDLELVEMAALMLRTQARVWDLVQEASLTLSPGSPQYAERKAALDEVRAGIADAVDHALTMFYERSGYRAQALLQHAKNLKDILPGLLSALDDARKQDVYLRLEIAGDDEPDVKIKKALADLRAALP